ncbi:MAG: ATP-binding protein [Candidatus Micrarchaeota archaeon]
MFDPKSFIEKSKDEMCKEIGKEKALCAISGGVDSTVCAALVSKAIGSSLRAVFIDTGFMREDETAWVKKNLEAMGVNLRVVDASERFISVLEGHSDAEDKRKIFRTTFYTLFSEIVREEKCKILIQGTIAPDWIETKGGIKSQHNVLSQIGIDPEKEFGYKVVEPLLQLYKDQVRLVGKELGLPEDLYSRQPFPGPGLLVRIVGEIRRDKLLDTRKAVTVVEEGLSDLFPLPQQCFAALLDSSGEYSKKMSEEAAGFLGKKAEVKVLDARGTGVTGDLRRYGKVALVTCDGVTDYMALNKMQFELVSRNKELSRVILTLKGRANGKHIAVIRSIQTRDFMTAVVSQVPFEKLNNMAEGILKRCKTVSTVCYELTPKPPATIEFE